MSILMSQKNHQLLLNMYNNKLNIVACYLILFLMRNIKGINNKSNKMLVNDKLLEQPNIIKNNYNQHLYFLFANNY